MKLKFKQQAYQSHAVEAVTDCFAGQPKHDRVTYRIDPGRGEKSGQQVLIEDEGFRNHDHLLPPSAVLENLRKIQQRQNLPLAAQLVSSKVSPLNFDVETVSITRPSSTT